MHTVGPWLPACSAPTALPAERCCPQQPPRHLTAATHVGTLASASLHPPHNHPSTPPVSRGCPGSLGLGCPHVACRILSSGSTSRLTLRVAAPVQRSTGSSPPFLWRPCSHGSRHGNEARSLLPVQEARKAAPIQVPHHDHEVPDSCHHSVLTPISRPILKAAGGPRRRCSMHSPPTADLSTDKHHLSMSRFWRRSTLMCVC